jgi:hypothetical protein
MRESLRSQCTRHDACTLPWSESTSEPVLELSRLHTPRANRTKWPGIHGSTDAVCSLDPHAYESEAAWASRAAKASNHAAIPGRNLNMRRSSMDRKSPAFQRLEPSNGTVFTQASDQNTQDLMLVNCLGLNRLRNRF